MKNTLKNLYNIDSVSSIKYSNKVYKIKDCKNNEYCLKFLDKQCNNNLIDKINILNLSDSFVMPIKSCVRSNQASIDNKLFYISSWVNDDYIDSKDLKLKYYLSQLAILHNKTSYTLNVTSSYFKELSMKIEEDIEECYQYYEKIINESLQKEYVSPFYWYLIFHYKDIIESLNKSKLYLEEFKKISNEKLNIREVIIHQNFSYDHVFLSKDKIIGNDKLKLASPIYDLLSLLDKVEFGTIDISGLLDVYFEKTSLLDYEKSWLLAKLFICNKIKIDNLDLINLRKLMNVIFKYKCALEIEKKLLKK